MTGLLRWLRTKLIILLAGGNLVVLNAYVRGEMVRTGSAVVGWNYGDNAVITPLPDRKTAYVRIFRGFDSIMRGK